MVFQGALNSLNPVIRVSDMIYDTADAHKMPRKDAEKRAFELFERVRLEPSRVFKAYPHELSGGMRQRVLRATALLLRPQIGDHGRADHRCRYSHAAFDPRRAERDAPN